MTYVVANTQAQGKGWAKIYLDQDERFEVLSTVRQVCGLTIHREDCVYITCTKEDLLKYLMPCLTGCRVTSCNKWINKKCTCGLTPCVCWHDEK